MTVHSATPRPSWQTPGWLQQGLAAALLVVLAGSAGWVCSAWSASASISWQASPAAMPCTRAQPTARWVTAGNRLPDPAARPCRPWA